MFEPSEKLLTAFQSTNPVRGLTHNFYRYPARLAPDFVRQAILEFSNPGDCILDTFSGGGTTVVESVASGRYGIGVDVNPLANFIAQVKTTPLSASDFDSIWGWARNIRFDNGNCSQFSNIQILNAPQPITNVIACASSTISELPFPRQQRFAKCVLLRFGQWALDCKKGFPTFDQMSIQFEKFTNDMMLGLEELVESAREQGIKKNQVSSNRSLFQGSIEQLIENGRFKNIRQKPRLVLTSPPYPGVHILYHRWQVNSRRETPLPYWIANLQDGQGETFYTMGGRSRSGLARYFTKLVDIYSALHEVIDEDALIVQVVAFSDSSTQLSSYLNAMNSAGYTEMGVVDRIENIRTSRFVPNRKWYTKPVGNNTSGNEFLLFHKLKV